MLFRSHEWEAEFQLNGIKMSANYSDTGIWLETEMAISATELPQIVSTSIKKKYIGWQITHAYKIETAHKGLLYEADIKSGMKKKEVLFQEDGTFIK